MKPGYEVRVRRFIGFTLSGAATGRRRPGGVRPAARRRFPCYFSCAIILPQG
jgi:hypothetical protein